MTLGTERKAAKIYYAEKADPGELAFRVAKNGEIGILDWGDPANMIFVLVGSAHDSEVGKRMNAVKRRDDKRTLAIAGSARIVEEVGDLSKSKPLVRSCQRLGLTGTEILAELFRYPVGVMVPAKDHLPDHVTSPVKTGRKVMVAGQSYNPELPYVDFYNQFIDTLFDKYGVFCGASSANRHDEEVYSVYQQHLAHADLGGEIDFVVMRENPDGRFVRKQMTSSTVFDLTGDRPVATRWGSRHVDYFSQFLKDVHIPHSVDLLPGADIGSRDLATIRIKQVVHSLTKGRLSL